jgi:hypothetical protein
MEPFLQMFTPDQRQPIYGRLRLLAIAAFAMIGYSVIAPVTRAWTEYGSEGTLTRQEAIVVRGLIRSDIPTRGDGYYPFAQRQSRGAIVSRLGYERWANETTGRYVMGGGYADVEYDAEGYAIGVHQRSF